MLMSANQRTFVPAGIYPAKLLELDEGTRTPFGAADGAEKSEPCFYWRFQLYSDEKRKVPIKSNDGTLVKQSITTGVQYGASRANLTKLITNLIGRKLTPNEVGRFPVESLRGIEVSLVIENDEVNGEKVSKIANVIPHQKFIVEAHLLPTDPFADEKEEVEAI